MSRGTFLEGEATPANKSFIGQKHIVNSLPRLPFILMNIGIP
jgi:hypothetical protein